MFDLDQPAPYGFGDEEVLDFITCEVDRGGKDDNMQCLDLGVRNVRLSLISQQDIAADKWKQQDSAQLPTVLVNFNQGKCLAFEQNKAQFVALKQLVPMERKKRVESEEKQKAEAVKRLRAPAFNLPAAQLNIINKRLDRNLLKLKTR